MKNDFQNQNFTFLTSVEVILPSGRSCSLPSLPSPRTSHTQSGPTAWWGWGGDLPSLNTMRNTCVTFANGVWKRSHTLSEPRWFGVAWQSPSGILLMGGDFQNDNPTSELLSTTTSTTTPGFNFQFKLGSKTKKITMYKFNSHLFFQQSLCHRIERLRGGD